MNKDDQVTKKLEPKVPPTSDAPSFAITILASLRDGVVDATVLGADVPYSSIQFALAQAQHKFHQDEIEAAMKYARQEKSEE